MRLLLDTHFDPAVARILREHGHDAVSVIELGPDVYQASDIELLAIASLQHRAIVTRNIRDFVFLHAMWMGQEQSHAGIVLVHSKTIPEGDRGAEIRALESLLRAHVGLEDFADMLVWLPPHT